MKRRQFITLVGAGAAWSVAARAQTERIRRIGILSGFAEDHPEGRAHRAALFQGLHQLGWIAGKNYQIEIFRWVTTDPERTLSNVQELVRLDLDLILTLSANPSAVIVLLKETKTTPIVFVNTADPLGEGISSSLSRPNNNVTGFPNFEHSMGGKWLELLKEIAPQMKRAALFFNPTTGLQGFKYEPFFREAAVKLGVEANLILWHDLTEMEQAFAAHGKGNGLISVNDTSNAANFKAVLQYASEYGLPAIFPFRWWTAAGGLISYGTDITDAHRRAVSYVDRVLRGEKPGNLPIQQPIRYEMVINMKTAKLLDLNIPSATILRADEVIE